MNRQMQPRAKATTKKYSVCEAPKVSEEELLSALVTAIKEKYNSLTFGLPGAVAAEGRLKNMNLLKKN